MGDAGPRAIRLPHPTATADKEAQTRPARYGGIRWAEMCRSGLIDDSCRKHAPALWTTGGDLDAGEAL
jgi:hypothetical protein